MADGITMAAAHIQIGANTFEQKNFFVCCRRNRRLRLYWFGR